MKIVTMAHAVLGALLTLTAPPRRDRRGLSQSAETAVLLAGAVVLAGVVVTVITAFVKAKLPK